MLYIMELKIEWFSPLELMMKVTKKPDLDMEIIEKCLVNEMNNWK
jgi:hypothetical protein